MSFENVGFREAQKKEESQQKEHENQKKKLPKPSTSRLIEGKSYAD